MNINFMNRTWESSNTAATLLLVSNVILSGLLAGALYLRSADHERVVLVPPHLDAKVSVGWASADADYLKGIGAYVAVLSGNVTPKNANFVADVLSGLVDASLYPKIRKQILALAQDPAFAKTGGSVSFEADRVLYDSASKKVFVVGDLITQNAGSPREAMRVVNEYRIEIRESRPVITAFNNYPGDQPRTSQWQQENVAQAAALAASAAESNKDSDK